MRKVRMYMRSIASVLIMALIFTCVNMDMLYAKDKKAETQTVVRNEKKETKAKKPKYVKELKGERTANSKTFLRDDSSYETIYFSRKIHEKSNRNKWSEISNKLETKTNKIKSEGLFDISFAKKSDEGKNLVEIKKDDFVLSWELIGQGKSDAESENVKRKNRFKNKEKVEEYYNSSSSVIYKNIQENVDLKYDLRTDELKESIILNAKAEETPVFEFEFETENLELIKDKDGAIKGVNPENKKTVYEFSNLFMQDAEGAYSEDIEIDLYELEGKPVLKIMPSEEWLNAEKRKYPVVIDPTLKLTSNSYDFYYENRSESDHNYTYIKPISVDFIRKGYLPISADFSSNVTYNNAATVVRCDYKAKKITESWNENSALSGISVGSRVIGELNWSYVSNVLNSNKIDRVSWGYTADGAAIPYFNFKLDIFDWVRDYYKGVSTAQNGIMIDAQFFEGGSYGNKVIDNFTISVEYVGNAGLEDYYSYHENDVGRAGNSYINNQTGELTFIHEAASVTNSKMPFSLSYAYNSSTGKWRNNYEQTIKAESLYDHQGRVDAYSYVDEDGTTHYFFSSGENCANPNHLDENATCWLPESGIGLELHVTAEEAILIDSQEAKMIFKNSSDNSVSFPTYYLNKIIANEAKAASTPKPENAENEMITVDFEDLTETSYSSPYKDGSKYNFRVTTPNNIDDAIYVQRKTDGYDSTVIFPHNDDKLVIITNRDGTPFDIKSFMYGGTMWSTLSDAVVTGYKKDGTTVTDNISSATKALQTKELNWKNVVKVVIDYSQGENKSLGSLDNFVLSEFDREDNLVNFEDIDYSESTTPAIESPYYALKGEMQFVAKGMMGNVENIISRGVPNLFPSKVIFPNNSGGRIEITRKQGLPFGLKTFQYGSGPFSSDKVDATITGTKSDGTEITEELVSTSFELKVKSLKWTDLTKVVIDYNGGENIGFGVLDNFVFTDLDNKGTDERVSNYVDITRNADNKITKIENNRGKKISIEYGSSNIVIRDNANNGTRVAETISLNSAGNFTSVTYPDTSNTVSFAYNDRGLLSRATDLDGVYVNYTYKTFVASDYELSEESNVVSNVKASSNSSTENVENYDFDYNMAYTIITDNNITEEENGVLYNKSIYQFNNRGNVVSFIDPYSYAGYSTYVVPSDSDSRLNNRIESETSVTKGTMNLLKNSDFENDTSLSGWGVPTNSNCSSDTTQKVDGQLSLKIDDNSRIYQIIPQDNIDIDNYTFSAYLMTNNKNAAVVMDYICKESGNWVVKHSQDVSFDEVNTWERKELNIPKNKIITDAEESRLRIRVTNDKGPVYVDNAQFEKAEIANNYNYIQESDFDTISGWTATDDQETVALVEDSSWNRYHQSNNVVRITGDSGSDKILKQTIKMNIKAGDRLVFGGWFKGFATNPVYISLGNEKIEFQSNMPSWQFASMEYIAPADSKSIELEIHTNGSENTLKFDGIILYRENASYKYYYYTKYDPWGTQNPIGDTDNDKLIGKVKCIVDRKGNQTQFVYNKKGNLKEIIKDDGNRLKYKFTSTGYLQKYTMESGLGGSTEYDKYGNPIIATVQKNDTDKPFIENRNIYSADGEYLINSIDEFGNAISYVNNENTGTLTSVTDQEGNTVRYEYNANNNRVTKSIATVDDEDIPVSYEYINDQISKISYNGMNYNFDYDAFGNSKSIAVGSQSIVSNEYDLPKGDLKKKTYGNGYSESYSYDNQGNMTEIVANGQTSKVKYYYLNNGLLGKSLSNNVTTWYTYDLLGRLEMKKNGRHNIRYIYDDTAGKEKDLRAEHTFNDNTINLVYENESDSFGRIIYDRTIFDSETNTATMSKETKYDMLDRVKTFQTFHDGNKIIEDSIEYMAVDGNAGKSSSRIAQYQVKKSNGTSLSNLKYTYDKVGNITRIEDKNTNKKAEYYYDEIYQLVRENNEFTNQTVTYEYDKGGNLLSKKTYALDFGNDALTTTPVEKVYEYSDSNWKDKLTKFDGTEIEYDAIGNPLNWKGIQNLVWDGSNLKTAVKGNVVYNYSYNDAGIRVLKCYNNYYTAYHLDGDKVVREEKYSVGPDKTPISDIYYSYDSSGQVIGMNYNDNWYFYVKNIHGDIIGILDNAGNSIVNYVYDSWGKLVDISGSQAQTIGSVNPYRYRGYRYDEETGLYYVGSSYYDPEVGRWLNSEKNLPTIGSTIKEYNLFAYCDNNPISTLAAVAILNQNGTAKSFTATSDGNMIPGVIRYNVPLYHQGYHSLCWAYSQKMVDDWYMGFYRTNKQVSMEAIWISINEHGANGLEDKENWDKGGWPTNLSDPLEIKGIDGLYNYLIERGPLYAYYSKPKSAHLVVVTGVDLNKGIVYTNNPWGIFGAQTYQEFLNGFVGDSSYEFGCCYYAVR